MRKRMHPHQTMDASELTFAARYAFISAPPALFCRDKDIRVKTTMMMGVLSNTIEQASQRGWDLKEQRRSQKGRFLTLPLDSLLTVSPSLRQAGGGGMMFVTLHQDGWDLTTDRSDRPTLVYWTEGQVGRPPVIVGYSWDYADTYFGDGDQDDPKTVVTTDIRIVVPDNRWFDDPKLLLFDA